MATDEFQIDEEMTIYKRDALTSVSFRIVYNIDHFKNGLFLQFKPEMAHQVFGESESIFGYRFLSITLNYLHNSSQCYVDIQKSGEIANELQKPDDIFQSLNAWLPENFTTSRDKFIQLLEKENHQVIFGKVLSEFKDLQESKLFVNQKVYANYKITLCDVNDDNFKDFHRRFETYIVWFIDAANFIDLDDERWLIFYVYEELQDPVTNELYVTPVGFCSVYKFFSYPNNIRARISQFFIIPSHQKRGLGRNLYHEVIRNVRNMPEVIDITVEEPTSQFQRIRDVDDGLVIHEELKKSNLNIFSCSQGKVLKIMKEFKICKRQCNRLYDILSCYISSKLNINQYKKHLDFIKKRIAADLEKESHGGKRMMSHLNGNYVALETDSATSVEAEFKKYMDDIEPSVKHLEKVLGNTSTC